jgi:hypothetical protein
MGKTNLDGKEITMEVVEGGKYRLEVVGDTSVYYFSDKVKFRPFVQRFMYKRYVRNPKPKAGDKKGHYEKTIMSDNLNEDLKDNVGTFNCGKPAGFVEDFKSLPVKTQDLIKSIKRNRIIFGIVDMVDPVKGIDGETVKDLPSFPVLWEIDNKEAYKTIGDLLNKFSKMERLPLQHIINLDGTDAHATNNGTNYYTPKAKLDLTSTIDIAEDDHKLFSDFIDWIKVHNDNVISRWDEAVAKKQGDISDEDMKTVDNFIDVDIESENV